MIFGPDDLRGLAECDARSGEPLGKGLRWAADEIERLRAEVGDLRASLDDVCAQRDAWRTVANR